MDWDQLFGVHVPLLELLIRASAVYWFLFLAFRFVLRRDIGALGVADILLVVIVADAAQNALAGEYKTISEGAIVIATIFAWNIFIDQMAFRFRWFERFARPSPRELVRDGRLLAHNLKRERMTSDELHEKLREHGVDRLADVRHAYLEGDGKVSVIQVKAESSDPGEDDRMPLG
ncbi:MAG TPA: YetF domain-containing protein [Polyangiales bacterium]|nr:YetF domain-containing protein [Polyangiales bacterium]